MFDMIKSYIKSYQRGVSMPEKIDLASLVIRKESATWYKSAEATPLVNVEEVRSFFDEIQKADPVAFFGLYSEHISEYTRRWGSPCFTYRSERNWKGWVVELSKNESLILLTSKGGGSAFEISGPGTGQWPPKLSNDALEVLLRIMVTINDEIAGPIKKRIEEKRSNKREDDGPSP